MKQLWILCICLPFLGMGQSMPPEETPLTAFNSATFGGGYLMPKMLQFLEQDPSVITANSQYLQISVTDLYRPATTPYERTTALDHGFKLNYLVPEYKKAQQLDRILSEAPQWRGAISELELEAEVLEPISRGARVSITHNTLFLIFPKKKQRTYIHQYRYNNKHQIVYKAYGYLNAANDSLMWQQTNYTYAKNTLVKEAARIYSDANQRLQLKKEESTQYKEGYRIQAVSKLFGHNGNQIVEERTQYVYKRRKLDHSETKIFGSMNQFEAPLKKRTIQYKRQKPIRLEEVSLKGDQRPIKTVTYSYDKKGRLTQCEQTRWTPTYEAGTSFVETLSYYKNRYEYTYTEADRMVRGVKVMPLQYKAEFRFVE